MEYPGYGIYQSEDPTENGILRDAEHLYRFFTKTLGIRENQIILMGRSLGTGPASYLASKYNPASLVLISGFTSIQSAAKALFGFFGGLVLKERFNNLKNMAKVKCPTLIIHGKKDTTVPWIHSE